MNLTSLLNAFSASPRLNQLSDRLSFASSEKIYLKNLYGSSSEFVAASVFMHERLKEFNHVFILNDAEEAAYFHNTLENLTNALNIFYYPGSFKSRKNFEALNTSHIMLRSEALTRFAQPTGARS